jgi:hypothetical protein
VAPKPVPVVVAMASPPPANEIVAPVLFAKLTPGLAPVDSDLLLPVKSTDPPELFCTEMPLPVEAMVPRKNRLPPVRPVTDTASGPTTAMSPL